MKKAIALFLVILSSNSFGYSVVDSMYAPTSSDAASIRVPASAQTESNYCLVSEDQKVFAASCYSTIETCNKRLEFWKDLAGSKKHSCAKI